MLQNQSFETTDSALAAYLISEGFTKPGIKLDNNRCVFCFIDNNNSISAFVTNYQSGKAIGNIPAFYHSYKHVLRRVHDGNW